MPSFFLGKAVILSGSMAGDHCVIYCIKSLEGQSFVPPVKGYDLPKDDLYHFFT